jgi:rRNA-processing protein EBP2
MKKPRAASYDSSEEENSSDEEVKSRHATFMVNSLTIHLFPAPGGIQKRNHQAGSEYPSRERENLRQQRRESSNSSVADSICLFSFLPNFKPLMKEKLDEMILELPWIERLDMTNDLAPLAPELAVQIERHEQKRENLFKGNKKIPYVRPEADPVLNDFKREILFHRQAQAAVTDGIAKLKELGVPTKRPDDYFAEMAKTDEHMQKIRKHLVAKQEGQQRSERVKQLRESKKMSKIIQRENLDKKQAEKRQHMNDLKAFRKGKLKNLDFLDDDKERGGGRPKKKHDSKKRNDRNKKFGTGGKKRGMKKNTKDSAMDTKDFSSKRNRQGVGAKALKGKKGGGGGGKPNKRLGKSRRVKGRS